KPITAISRDDCFNRFARLSKTSTLAREPSLRRAARADQLRSQALPDERRAADGREPGGCPQTQLASEERKVRADPERQRRIVVFKCGFKTFTPWFPFAVRGGSNVLLDPARPASPAVLS